MKKLYHGKAGRVHPAPPAAAVLPAAVLALASALTAEEQEVLAYLLCGGGAAEGRRRRRGPHPPEMGCGCFGCYKSFWARWDASPNRHLIHRIIDAVEEHGGGGGPPRRPRRRRRGRRGCAGEADADADAAATDETDASMVHKTCDDGEDGDYEGDGDDEEDSMDGDENDEMMEESNYSDNNGKSAVRRLVSFIGEKVWGVWN